MRYQSVALLLLLNCCPAIVPPLAASPPPTSGGVVNFRNKFLLKQIDAPVFDVDGVTGLAGDAYLAQLFSGPSASELIPVGSPVPFYTGTGAGYWNPGTNSARTLPNVAPGATAFIQVRAWEAAAGLTYEKAVESGNYGSSRIITVVTGGGGVPPSLPADLVGLESFRLELHSVIARQPVGASVWIGEAVQLEVGVAATATPSFQWQRNGQAIEGATNATLILTNIQLNQAGSYVVVVTGDAAPVNSRAAAVVVNPIPEGATVAFSNRDSKSGLDAPVFDLDGTTRLAGDAFVAQLYAGRTADSLSPVGTAVPFQRGAQAGYWQVSADSWRAIPGVAPGGTAFVQVLVWERARGDTYEQALAAGGKVGGSDVFQVLTGGIGAPSPWPVILTGLRSFQLGRIPQITTQPRSQYVLTNTAVALRVEAVSADPVTYQWRLNGADIPGATTPTHVIASVQSTDEGHYTVIVRNRTGAASSAVATLRIDTRTSGGTVYFANRFLYPGIDAPVFDTDGAARLVGDAFRAQLFSGRTPNDLVEAGTPVGFRTGEGAGYLNHGGNATRALPNVRPGGLAYIQIRVWEAAAGASFTNAVQAGGKFGMSKVISLIAGGAEAEAPGAPPSLPAFLVGLESFRLEQVPVITRQPMGAVGFVGEMVVLEVAAQSVTPVSYQWELKGIPIPGATSPTLVLGPVDLTHAGNYRVVVSNATGSRTSAEAILSVRPIPPGGTVRFSNHVPGAGLDAPVFDTDGVTRLAGQNFQAQLYGGADTNNLAPIGSPVPFLTGASAGYWDDALETGLAIPGVNPNERGYVQVRVWDRAYGDSYDKALLAGGRVRASEVLEVVAGGGAEPPASLTGLKSFNLNPGRPVITQGPADIGVIETGTAVFNVLVTNANQITYHWQRETDTNIWENLSGAVTPQLKITQVDPTDAGRYRVLVTNAGGTTVSEPAVLFVSPILAIGPALEAFHMSVRAGTGPDYRIEASTNLATWSLLGTGQTTGQVLEFTDPSATNYLARFYRAKSVASGAVACENAVGFVRLWIPPGFSMVANPLLTTNASIAALFKDMPAGTIVYLYDVVSGFSVNEFEPSAYGGWTIPDQTLVPGQGAMVINPTHNTYLLNVKGAVAQGNLAHTVPAGWTLQSSEVPIAGQVDTALGFPLDNGDVFARFDNLQGEFTFYAFLGVWVGDVPVIGVGECFWAYKKTPGAWRRTFSIDN